MIVDTSALLAFFDDNEPAHARVNQAITESDELLVISPYVVAELDYLVLSRHGSDAERRVLEELGSGAWELAQMDGERARQATAVVANYTDVPVGVTDASLIALAEAYGTRTIATLDRRHFSILRLTDGKAPDLVP